MNKITTIFISSIAPFMLSSIAHAELNTQYVMSLDMANVITQNVMQACKTSTKPAAVVVLDQEGMLLQANDMKRLVYIT